MKKIWDRFRYVSEGVPQNPLMYLFFLITAAYGVAFTFFQHTEAVTGTILYQLTLANLGPHVLSLWGVVAILVIAGTLVGIYVRKTWLGQAVSMGGFLLWVYSLFLYGLNGFILQVFGLAIPNMLFWAWWYFIIQGYHRQYD